METEWNGTTTSDNPIDTGTTTTKAEAGLCSAQRKKTGSLNLHQPWDECECKRKEKHL